MQGGKEADVTELVEPVSLTNWPDGVGVKAGAAGAKQPSTARKASRLARRASTRSLNRVDSVRPIMIRFLRSFLVLYLRLKRSGERERDSQRIVDTRAAPDLPADKRPQVRARKSTSPTRGGWQRTKRSTSDSSL